MFAQRYWVRGTCRVGGLLSLWVVCTPGPTYLLAGQPAHTHGAPTYLFRWRSQALRRMQREHYFFAI